MIIKKISDNETVEFASEELVRYLNKLDRNIPAHFTIELGSADLGDVELDTIDICIGKAGGYLHGSNPRSVLYAVYRYLEALGIRWLRHGKDGEYLPEGIRVCENEVVLRSTAARKYRGMCIEGSVSIENMLDNIDWAAKAGFNMYFIQFMCPEHFFKMWYHHQYNPTLDAIPITPDDIMEFKRRMIIQIRKRGMLFMDVGHTWTLSAFGITGDLTSTVIPEHLKENFAKVPGMRPLQDTQLCHSKPHVRKKVVDYVVSYALEHPEADVLAFCLADGEHNHCECEDCIKMRPTDWYFILLNEIDEALTRANCCTKICFAAYLDLLWLPLYENLKNKDRFIMMFSPIGRNYLKSYADVDEIPMEESYVLNKMAVPETVECNMGFFQRMYALTGIESFAFEYYYWRGGEEHYGDYGGINLAKTIYKDLSVSDSFGLMGMMSCQTQRSFMPSGFGNFIMSKMLWYGSCSYENLEREYFSYMFGDYSQAIVRYLTDLSDLSKGNLKLIKEKAEDMLAYLNSINTCSFDECRRKSVYYLIFHANKLIRYINAEDKTLKCGLEAAMKEWQEFLKYIRENELSVQTVFDLYLYLDFIASKREGLKEIFLK